MDLNIYSHKALEVFTVASMNALRVEHDASIYSKPRAGKIYRDLTNRSFVVLRVHSDGVFVEYADGTTRTVSKNGWFCMKPQPALF